jgi:hypothetical protein
MAFPPILSEAASFAYAIEHSAFDELLDDENIT